MYKRQEYGEGMVLALISALCAALFGTLNSIWGRSVPAMMVSRIELTSACVLLGAWLTIVRILDFGHAHF